MRKLLSLFGILSLFVLCFSQVALQEAAPAIQKLGILKTIDDSALTYDELYSAVAKAFPGKESLVKKGTDQVLRKDFIMILVKVLGLEQIGRA
ncbi:MAG TPA: 4-phytase, partial [Pseudothermotoga sp.]|nr:4-phytase [Pseudothermotoga sp.]